MAAGMVAAATGGGAEVAVATVVVKREAGMMAEGLEVVAKEGVERERGEEAGAEETATVAAAADYVWFGQSTTP